jgi:uncharacterized protein YbjT (DUF2867 family)
MISVAGGTGTVGSNVARTLLEHGETVRVLTRDESKARELFGSAVEVAVVDYDEPDTLKAAFSGASKAFLSVGTSENQVPNEIDQIDAAISAGVEFLVELSSAGAETPGHNVPGWHHEIDAYLTSRGTDFTLLRPSTFISTFVGLAGPFIQAGAWGGLAGDGRAALIDARDVSDVAARILLDGPLTHSGKTYNLTGPDSLTATQLAGLLSAATGTTIDYHDRTEQEQRSILSSAGVSSFFVDVLVFLDLQVRYGASATPTTTTLELTGTSPRTVASWIVENTDLFAGSLA